MPVKLTRLTLWLVLSGSCILLMSSSVPATDEIESVLVSVDRDSIGMDEQIMLQVEVIGTNQNLPAPKIPTLPMFEVYSQGRSSNLSIVNGQVSASVTYRYMLLPQKAGTFPIRGVAVVHNNRRYEGNPLEVTVLGTATATPPSLEGRATDSRGQSRDYFMEAVVDNKNPFVNQQVTLTLKIYFAVQTYGSPELSEPTTTGFWTEVLGNKAPYFQKINNRNYRVIERKYALFPTQTGTLSIGRAVLTATVAKRSRRRDPFDFMGMFGSGEEVTMRTLPVDIEVRPLPTVGRPRDFTGTIGRFSITASADKREVEVNQPVSVTFRISGVGNIKSVAEPVLPDLNDFRIYRASSSENVTKLDDKIGGTKVYEEVFIPKVPGEMIIPSVAFSFFNPETERYASVRTRAITLQVSKPEGYVAGSEVPYTAPEMTIGSRSRDIRFIKKDAGDLSPIGRIILFSPVYVAVNAVPVFLLAGMVVLRLRREKLAGDIGYARSRAASRMARKRLAKAKSVASTETAQEFYAEISLALLQYVADKLNISPHGLTTDSLSQLLRERSADETLIEETVEFLQECDYARFAAAGVDEQKIVDSLESAEKIMVKIEGVRFV
ncbi:MAG: protein BatD [Candidatus Zixiibacteriota bacterium]|nr:MAG: protein BatD [candidate division Zixibacteria bacterium]